MKRHNLIPLVIFALFALAIGLVFVLRPFERLREAEPIPEQPEPLVDTGPAVVRVVVRCPGQSAEEVEQIVCVPLEVACATLQGLGPMRSHAVAGKGVVELGVPEGRDVFEASQRVHEAAVQASGSFPAGSTIFLEKDHPHALPLVWVTFHSPDGSRSPGDLAKLAESQRKDFAVVPGVGDILVRGGAHSVNRLVVDPQKLQALDVSLSDVVAAVRGASARGFGGGGLERIDLRRLRTTAAGKQGGGPLLFIKVWAAL